MRHPPRSWSSDGTRLVSASGDGTAKLWRPLPNNDEDSPPSEALVTLSHDAFVYCARFQPRASTRAPLSHLDPALPPPPSLLLTGANDCAVRLWDVEGAEVVASKADAHKSRVNCAAWVSDKEAFTADGTGIIKQWEVTGSARTAELRSTATIDKAELEGFAINSIAVHPSRRRVLLQTRHSQLLSLDTRLHHFSARYRGSMCSRYQLRAEYSPDGRFVAGGSEDGTLYIWAEETGDLLMESFNVGFSAPLLQIGWCPHDHIIALCAYGAKQPVLLYYHDPESPYQPAAEVAALMPPKPISSLGAAPLADATGGTGLSATATSTASANLAEVSRTHNLAAKERAAARRAARKLAPLSSSADGADIGAPRTPLSAVARAATGLSSSVDLNLAADSLASGGVSASDDVSARRKAAAAERRAQQATMRLAASPERRG